MFFLAKDKVAKRPVKRRTLSGGEEGGGVDESSLLDELELKRQRLAGRASMLKVGVRLRMMIQDPAGVK